MLKHISILGLLGVATLGAVAMPAQADTAVVQQTTQDMYIDGNGNATVQRSQQINHIEHRGRARRSDSTGIVQDALQTGTVFGDGNAAYQENNQVNVIQERTRPNNHGRRQHRNVYIEQN